MPRDRTPRFVLALAALLVGLQFLGVMVPGGSGHAAYGPAAAPLEPSTDVVVADGERTDEFAPCGDVGQIAGLKSWTAGRDRRHAVEPDTDRAAAGAWRNERAALPPGGLTASHLASRSPATGSLASLQLLRC
ncbi:hypothetical protein OG252_46500 [Streptomyces sp. NBC_01352]|uniref:hypothetical protein n=1 Tax=unclassified Streptomyces TaxID=2593676 RepID=UPI00225AAD52|nr:MULTISPECIES: hypothetical protein [unclassified Streptomyces]MCX4703266.1 hypothetical protein [Streptomyces sp. NBC_01373]